MVPPPARKRTATDHAAARGGDPKRPATSTTRRLTNDNRASAGRPSAATRPSSTKAIATRPAASKSSSLKTPSKGTGHNTVLSALGFSSSKRPKFPIGTKILLDETIYNTNVPPDVQGHLFVYEITEVGDDGKSVTVLYKKQVIRKGGHLFRVYDDDDDPQVSCIFICSILSLF
jgi:hypothetical protein